MREQKLNENILSRARKIKLLLMDCDGVLTDGRLYYSANGEELKAFHVRDGLGIVSWHNAGFFSGIITGRQSKILETRAKELGMHFIEQASKDKAEDFEKILSRIEVSADEVAFIGDDLTDLVLFEKVGFAAAVADAACELFTKANYITKLNGGLGAVREVIDLLLDSKR